MTSALTYMRTLRHLKPVQVYGRIAYRMRRPKPDHRPAPSFRAPSEAWIAGPRKPRKLLSSSRARFLNREAEIADPQIWSDRSLSHLFLYNLHYFDALLSDAEPDHQAWAEALVPRWIVENPAAGTPGWEPYAISLRLVNWLKWHLETGKADDVVRQSLAVQARFLTRRLEHHIQGNHLLTNAKALAFAGLCFEGEEAAQWERLASRLLDEQIAEQILAEGAHYELSPMYQDIVIEDLLDIVNLRRAYGQPASDRLQDAIRHMLSWSRFMRHPDGRISFFNDAAFGIAPDGAALEDYGARLGISPAYPQDAAPTIRDFYGRATRGPAVLLTDLAPLGPDHLPAHGHADTLSFELSLGAERAIVNGGTSRYGTEPEREAERSTAAHSTLVIDGTNSSEVWSGFRVGRRARVIRRSVVDTPYSAIIGGAHDGYCHLRGRPVHSRRWELDGSGLTVIDDIDGRGFHSVDICFHFGPTVQVEPSEPQRFSVPGYRFRVTGPAELSAALIDDLWHPEFGLSVHSSQLRFSGSVQLPVRFTTRFDWVADP